MLSASFRYMLAYFYLVATRSPIFPSFQGGKYSLRREISRSSFIKRIPPLKQREKRGRVVTGYKQANMYLNYGCLNPVWTHLETTICSPYKDLYRIIFVCTFIYKSFYIKRCSLLYHSSQIHFELILYTLHYKKNHVFFLQMDICFGFVQLSCKLFSFRYIFCLNCSFIKFPLKIIYIQLYKSY